MHNFQKSHIWTEGFLGEKVRNVVQLFHRILISTALQISFGFYVVLIACKNATAEPLQGSIKLNGEKLNMKWKYWVFLWGGSELFCWSSGAGNKWKSPAHHTWRRHPIPSGTLKIILTLNVSNLFPFWLRVHLGLLLKEGMSYQIAVTGILHLKCMCSFPAEVQTCRTWACAGMQSPFLFHCLYWKRVIMLEV